jgi:hypothetical protein
MRLFHGPSGVVANRYESGDQVGAFDEKHRIKKSRASVPLK